MNKLKTINLITGITCSVIVSNAIIPPKTDSCKKKNTCENPEHVARGAWNDSLKIWSIPFILLPELQQITYFAVIILK
jgi:hypothetical protein